MVATGLKLEDEIALPDIPSIKGKSVVTAGIGRAQVKLPGNRREQATGANVELNLTAGERESTQVPTFSYDSYLPIKYLNWSTSSSLASADSVCSLYFRISSIPWGESRACGCLWLLFSLLLAADHNRTQGWAGKCLGEVSRLTGAGAVVSFCRQMMTVEGMLLMSEQASPRYMPISLPSADEKSLMMEKRRR